MKLTKLEIHNYRSIKNIVVECSSLLTLLGGNNHGKSNVLSALEFGLTTSFKPVEQDFFALRQKGDDELWVEMTFCKLTEQEKNTFNRYTLSGDTICIRKTARLSEGEVKISYNGWVNEPEKEWLRASNAGNYTSRKAIGTTGLSPFLSPGENLTKKNIKEAQDRYIEQHRANLNFQKKLEDTPLLGSPNVGGGILPDFFLIPAVRDLTDETKIKTTTAFGRLMNRAVREMAERDERFIKSREQIETVVASLNQRNDSDENPSGLSVLEKNIEEELSTWGVKVDIEVTPPEIEKLFELGTDIHLNDGIRTTADRKGHGLQRAMIFALLQSWAATIRLDRQAKGDSEVAARRPSDSVIFAMEEPELFLHPHAQRKLSDSLREISEKPEHQVFISTHSTHFVALEHYKEIAIISKEEPARGSEVRQCTDELFEGESIDEDKKQFRLAHWINPERGEMFFARRVVFVEGETEKVVIPYLAKKLEMFDSEVSVIDCGSKYNLSFYIEIAKKFNIPYLVVHDEDQSSDSNRQNEKISRLVESPLGEIKTMDPDFEGASHIPSPQGSRKGKALAALDHFARLSNEEIPECIKDLIEAVYRSPSC